jgi:hypothetical protein
VLLLQRRDVRDVPEVRNQRAALVRAGVVGLHVQTRRVDTGQSGLGRGLYGLGIGMGTELGLGSGRSCLASGLSLPGHSRVPPGLRFGARSNSLPGPEIATPLSRPVFRGGRWIRSVDPLRPPDEVVAVLSTWGVGTLHCSSSPEGATRCSNGGSRRNAASLEGHPPPPYTT